MIEIRIIENIFADGIDIYVSLKGNGGRTVLQFGEDGNQAWKILSPADTGEIRPTLTLADEAARALLDALLRRYEGASDMHTVRADLLHERGRVDRMLDALLKAMTVAGR